MNTQRILVAYLVLCCSPLILRAAPPAPLTDPGELFARLDRNGDGRVEAAEIEPAHARLFRKLLTAADGNRDGALTRDELIAGLKENRPERPLEKLPDPPTQEEVARAVFMRLDGDRNQRLELKEVPSRRQALYRKLLPTADKDGNGSLDVSEFKAVYEQLMVGPESPAGEGNPVDAATMLKQLMQLDANGDGNIDRQEARGPVANRFDRIDTDGNGVLDQQEIKQAAERFARAAADPERKKLSERLEGLQKKLDKNKKSP